MIMLRAALLEVTNKKDWNARSIGSWLSGIKDKMISGRALRHEGVSRRWYFA